MIQLIRSSRVTTAAVLVIALGSVSLSGCSNADTTERPPGPVDYETAKQIVIDRLEPDWDLGTFCLDDRQIVENDKYFSFDVGAREYIVDNDKEFAYAGGVPVVYKRTGRFAELPSSEVALDNTLRISENPDASNPVCG